MRCCAALLYRLQVKNTSNISPDDKPNLHAHTRRLMQLQIDYLMGLVSH